MKVDLISAPVLLIGPKPLPIEFCINHRLKSCARMKTFFMLKLIFSTFYRTLSRFWLSLTRLWYTLAVLFCLMGRKLKKSLPISARHKQPSLMQGGQRGVVEGQKRVRARYFHYFSETFIFLFILLSQKSHV